MAIMTKEKKALIAKEIKSVMPEGWKYSLTVHDKSTIILTIKSAPIDIMAHIREVWEYNENAKLIPMQRKNAKYTAVNGNDLTIYFKGEMITVFTAIFKALNIGNFDRSDLEHDYFDVGHYVIVNIGTHSEPFITK